MNFLPNKTAKLAGRAVLGGAFVLLLSAGSCSDSEDGSDTGDSGGAAAADFRSFVLDAFANTNTDQDATPINDLDLDTVSSLEPDAFISLLEGN